MSLGKKEVSIRIVANAVRDPYARFHGVAIDQELNGNFWISQPEKVAGVSAATFVYERRISLAPFAKHMIVYAPSGKYPDYSWKAEITVDEIKLVEGLAGYNKHLVGTFRIVAGKVVPTIIHRL